MQRYLGSMEGAVLSGKLAAQAIGQSSVVTDLETTAKVLQPASS